MHLLRLLASSRDLLRTGRSPSTSATQREPLLAVKRGEVPWREVERWMSRLATEAEEARRGSPLPAEPDHARVEDFLVRVRRASALRECAAPRESARTPERAVPSSPVDRRAASDAVRRTAEGRPRTGCMRAVGNAARCRGRRRAPAGE